MPDDDNGCLSRINGEHVALARSLCPDPKDTPLDRVQVTIEVPLLGAVLVTCVRKRDPRRHRPY